MAIGQSAGLLFKIDGDSSGLKRELAVAEGSINKFGSQFSNIAGIATSAASAIAIMGTAVFTAGKYLFDLTRAASDYGSAINDATQKSGASVQSIQALGFAAEQSGSSLDAIAGSVAKFSNLLGQASLGNKEAQETLEQFGITATTVDEALTQAIASIQSMTSETQQNAAAATLFKDRGGEVVKTIREMGGSLPDTIKKLEDMGIMMSREDTKAADAFGDSLGLLSTQVKLLGYRFANEFMPQVTAAIQSISRFLIANKDIIKGWGNDIGIVINGVANAFRMLPQVIGGVFNAINVLFGTSLSTTASWANGMRFILGPLGELFRMISGVGQMAGADIVSGASTAASSVIGQIATPKLNTGGGGKGGGGGKSAAKSDAEARAKADMQARIDIEKLGLDVIKKIYEDTLEAIRKEFAKTGDDVAFVTAANLATEEFAAKASAAISAIQALQDVQAKGEKETENQTRLRHVNQKKEIDDLNEFKADQFEKNNELLADSDQRLADKIIDINTQLTADLIAINQERQDNFIKSEEDIWDEMINDQVGFVDEQNKLRGEAYNYMAGLFERERDRRLMTLDDEYKAAKTKIEKEIKDEDQKQKLLFDLDELYKQKRLLSEEEFQEQLREIQAKYSIPVGAGEDGGYGPFQGLIDGWKAFVDQVNADAPTLGQTMQAIGGMMVNAFSGIANALGSVVEQWVLMGSTGPAVMRKILAAALASIAAEAAVRAIWELALGFATLFTNPAESSGHFIAAALFGSIAVGAALAGRAVAGDAFKQQNQAATGGGGSGGGSNATPGETRYTTEFGGYGTGQNPLHALIKRQNTVLGQVEETIHQFNRKVTSMTPGEVVAMGASDASRDIRQAYESELQGSVAATDRLMRATGRT